MIVLVLLTATVVVIFTVQGFRVGLVRRCVEFLGVVASFLFATSQATFLAGLVPRPDGMPSRFALYVVWIVLFVIGLVITRLIALALSKAIQVSIIGWLDRMGGAVFGLLAGALLASIILVGLSRLPGGDAVRSAFAARPITRMVFDAAPTLYRILRDAGGDHDRVWEWIDDGAERRTAGRSVPSAPHALGRVE